MKHSSGCASRTASADRPSNEALDTMGPAWVHGLLDRAFATTQQISHLADADLNVPATLDVICMVDDDGSGSENLYHAVCSLVAALRCAFTRARMPPPPPRPSPACPAGDRSGAVGARNRTTTVMATPGKPTSPYPLWGRNGNAATRTASRRVRPRHPGGGVRSRRRVGANQTWCASRSWAGSESPGGDSNWHALRRLDGNCVGGRKAQKSLPLSSD